MKRTCNDNSGKDALRVEDKLARSLFKLGEDSRDWGLELKRVAKAEIKEFFAKRN